MTGHVEVQLKSNNRLCIDQVQSFDELVHDQEIKTGVCSGIKLGWVKGVLVPCLLSIWGVMLFLKMPWILGQAGIFDSVVIIFVSLIIILITTFSLSAISTNGKIKGGGLYFIISRSIGPELGASIGILFAFANTISVAMNSIGFCLSLQQLLQSYDIHIIDEKFEFKTLGVTSIIVLSIVCCIGMDREAEIQNTLLMVILVGIFNVIVGSFMGPTSVGAKASGFTGLSMDTFEKNWHSDYRFQGNTHHSIFTIFAFFFPSVTGIQAGANISGDLKDPSSAIPKGTLLSILITITSYVILIIVPGAVQLREASGITDEYIFNNGTHLDCSSRNCTKGLHYDSNLFQSISLWPITIYFGCFGATLSTALTALISVPKIVQRMGQDDIYPLFKYLAKGYGKSQEPYRAHVFAMFVSSALLIIVDDLNDLAPLISTIYLSAYALLNVCTFHVAYFKPLGWRPSYTFYNKWLSLTGAVICISLMIFIDKQMSAIVACFICVLYKIAARKHDVLNWGSSKQTQQIKAVLNSVYKANTVQYHVKNFLPNVMVLSGNPESRKKLISLAHLITKNNGVQTCVNAEKRPLTTEQKEIYLDRGIKWLKNAEIKSLYVVIDNVELDVATHMVYSCGHGQLRTNMVLVGYKSDWLNCPYEDLRTFLNIFNVANVNGIALIMVRVSSTEGFKNQNVLLRESKQSNEIDTLHQQSNRNNNSHQKVSDSSLKINDGEFLFTNKLKKSHGTIDVWWLYNDGGLALLIACILRSSTTWKHCKFRIFGVTDRVECLSKEKIKLNQLLSMYRVHFDYLDIILTSTTNPTTMTYFTSLLERVHPEGNQFDEYKVHEKNIAETLFLRDLIELHSLKSDLIILSTPRTNEQMNTLFMCWIETITRGLPPCIIINGNTGPVLTANA